jgi:hypothetical protein
MSFCPANCPLCGRENECQSASSSYKGKCWCAREDFSPDLLARIPEEARNVVCVCRRCVVAANFAEAKARPLPPSVAGDFYIVAAVIVAAAVAATARSIRWNANWVRKARPPTEPA